MKALLILVLVASPLHAASACGPITYAGSYGPVCSVVIKGSTLAWGGKGQWLYSGHYPYKWSVTTNGVITYHQSGKPTL